MEKEWYCCRKEAPAFHIIFMHILISARLCLEYLVHWPTLAHVQQSHLFLLYKFMGPSLPSFFDLLLLSSTTQIYNIQYNINFIISLSLSLSQNIIHTYTHKNIVSPASFFFFLLLAFLHSQPVKPELLTTMILILIYIYFQ